MQVLPDFYTIAFLKSATGQIKINNQTIQLIRNTVLFIPASQTVDISGANFLDGYFIFFEGAFLDKFFNENHFVYKFSFFHNADNPHYLRHGEDTNEDVYSIFENIDAEIRNLQEDSEHLIRAYLYQLLIKFNRRYTAAFPHLHQNSTINDYLLKLRYKLDREVKNHNNVQYYADYLGISRTYLNLLCMNCYAKTSSQIIKERLALEIKKELLYSSKTVHEITYEYNFSDPPNFIRFFKRMTKQTPLQYRKLSKRQS